MGSKIAKKASKPIVRTGDESVIKSVCKVIMDEKISSPEQLRERFKGDTVTNAAIARNAKVVAATIELVRTTGQTNIKSSFVK